MLEVSEEVEVKLKKSSSPGKGSWGYRSYREHLREKFPGQVVRKLSLNAGFTCPNLDGHVARKGCTYCNNRGFVPEAVHSGDLKKQWEVGRRYLKKRYRKVDAFIAYFQAFSNTYASVDRLRELYDRVPYDFEQCVGLSIGTRPDCMGNDILDYLSEVNERTFMTVELGLQSDRDEVLESINRGHGLEIFLDAVKKSASRGFEMCAHFILGLKGEGEDAPERMGRLAASLPIQSVKIHNFHLMKGTESYRQYLQKPYPLLEREDYLERVYRFASCLRPDQSVQRLLADAPDSLLKSSPWCHDKQGFLTDLSQHFEASE